MLALTLALLIFLFPLAFSPGPGNMIFAANGARFGFCRTLPASAGYHSATWIVTCAIGFGFTAVMQEVPLAFTLLRWAGAAYVLHLAWGLARAGSPGAARPAAPAGFLDGAVLLVLNPKAYMIIALMFSQFLGQTELERSAAILWITTIFTLNNLVAFTAWTLVGDRIAARFRGGTGARRLNRALGAALVVVALWMLLG